MGTDKKVSMSPARSAKDLCGQSIATRDAYGLALVDLGGRNEQVVVLDADLSAFPNRIWSAPPQGFP